MVRWRLGKNLSDFEYKGTISDYVSSKKSEIYKSSSQENRKKFGKIEMMFHKRHLTFDNECD